MVLHQTPSEIYRVMVDWESFHAPKNFIATDENRIKLVDYASAQGDGIISFTSLNNACAALAAQVLQPEPKQPTIEEQAAEFQAKEFKRIQREQRENSVPFDERLKAAKAKKDAEDRAKAEADAETMLNNEIMSYQCYAGPNRIDYTITNQIIQQLKAVAVRIDGKRSAIETLKAVRDVIRALPDRPTLGAVEQAIETVNRQRREAREPGDRKIRDDARWASRPR